MPGFLSNTALAKTYEHYNKLASVTGAPRDRSVLQFINGLQDMGIWSNLVCWPLHLSQNVGKGAVVYSIGGLGNFDGAVIIDGSWISDGVISSQDTPSYVKISNGAGLLSAQEITSGAAYNITALAPGELNTHYWIYGNQLGETDNQENGGGFREGPGLGLIAGMRDTELSAAYGFSEITDGNFQFLTNVTTVDLNNNCKTFLNGELKTSYTTPIYYFLENENESLSSINTETDSLILTEEGFLQSPLNSLLLVCQDGITNLLQQDSTTLFVDNNVHDSSYQIGRIVVPQSEPNAGFGIASFHFIIKDTTLTEEQVAFIYKLYQDTIAKQTNYYF